VQLSNSRRLVVNLSSMECSCGWWQVRAFPCKHAMVVLKEKKWVYDYVNVYDKVSLQKTCCMNSIHPMETHDMSTTDDRTGHVIGGDALDDDFNHRILPLINPRKRGDHNLRGGNHIYKELNQRGVPSVVRLATIRTCAGIQWLTSMLIMRVMLSQWRIYWGGIIECSWLMWCGCTVVFRKGYVHVV